MPKYMADALSGSVRLASSGAWPTMRLACAGGNVQPTKPHGIMMPISSGPAYADGSCRISVIPMQMTDENSSASTTTRRRAEPVGKLAAGVVAGDGPDAEGEQHSRQHRDRQPGAVDRQRSEIAQDHEAARQIEEGDHQRRQDPGSRDRQHPLGERQLYPWQAARQHKREHDGAQNREQPDEQERGAPSREIADQRAKRRTERHGKCGAADHRGDRLGAMLEAGKHDGRRLCGCGKEPGSHAHTICAAVSTVKELLVAAMILPATKRTSAPRITRLRSTAPVSVARIGVPIA